MPKKKLKKLYEDLFQDVSVLEFYGGDLEELQDQVHALASRTKRHFLLTVPVRLDQAPILEFLAGYFREVLPLNVGTNPNLKDHTVETRRGWLCLK